MNKKILIFISLTIAFLLSILVFLSVKKTEPTSSPVPKSLPQVEEEVEGELISGFPEFPEYPGSLIKNSSKEVKAPQVIFTGEWEVKEDVNVLVSWYLDELEKGGWVVEESEKSLKATKDKGEYRVTFTADGQKTKVSLSIIFTIVNEYD